MGCVIARLVMRQDDIAVESTQLMYCDMWGLEERAIVGIEMCEHFKER